MIDLDTYRQRIGGFNHCRKRRKRERSDRMGRNGKKHFVYKGENQTIFNGMFILYYIYILYLYMFASSATIYCAAGNCADSCVAGSGGAQLGGGHGIGIANSRLPFLTNVHIKVAYFALICFICRRFINLITYNENYSTMHYSAIKMLFLGKRTSRLKNALFGLLLAVLLINFLLIGIVNPSLLNPGPQNFSVYYQNVNGLIPFSNLKDMHPSLNRTKIFELNCYINQKRPAMIMLTETWLKKSIKDREIIENPDYTIFRCDRSILSHPQDPDNPAKYRKFGGGVLIAIRSDINASFKRVSVRKGVEMVAVEVEINNTKFVFCNYYRVGTLGIDNHSNFVDSIRPFFQSKRPKKIFIIGDFNLSSVNWLANSDHDHTSVNPTEKLFLDSFNEFGLSQSIITPTHNKNKTLDILLSNHSQLISNLSVLSQESICNSDHYPILFDIKTNVKLIRGPKRKIYNFKRANWDALNHDLRHTNWNALLDRTEPELAWSIF